jgi:hypothetical protein
MPNKIKVAQILANLKKVGYHFCLSVLRSKKGNITKIGIAIRV